jgi:RNA polymerase sigma factor (sigma-70 family)
MSRQAGPVLRFIRQLSASPSPDTLADEQLLQRFTEGRDEEAFAKLVERHGPLVLSVCRRLVNHEQDAEDAFQVTFLVLARRARSIRKRGSLSSWLYGVAFRVACKERAGAAQRRRHEHELRGRPAANGTPDADWRDVRGVLDQEVSRLPAHYRDPVILCYLQGQTAEEAARQLGCPRGTILSRLARARERLRGRLARRGLALSAGLLATGLAEEAAVASVSVPLLTATVRAAARGVAGPGITVLLSAVLRGIAMNKLKWAGVVLLAAALGGAGGVGLAHSRMSAEGWTIPGHEEQPMASAREPEQPKGDRELLQGTWTGVSGEINGKALPAETAKQLTLVLTADRYTTKRGDQLLFEGKYTIHPATEPKAMDILAQDGPNAGQAARAIYALEGDTLKLCYGPAGKERPGKFVSEVGSGLTYVVWKRVKS